MMPISRAQRDHLWPWSRRKNALTDSKPVKCQIPSEIQVRNGSRESVEGGPLFAPITLRICKLKQKMY